MIWQPKPNFRLSKTQDELASRIHRLETFHNIGCANVCFRVANGQAALSRSSADFFHNI
jgi:hypothetical protein